jgi:shikimate dehydrogenase
MLHGFWLRTLGLPGRYEAQDVAPEALGAFMTGLRSQGFTGGNVTIPHKLAVIPYLSRIDAAAKAIGAVNTIWTEGGQLAGGNTDAHGFLANLDEGAPGWDAQGGVCVVLGAGGAARAAVYGLLQRGMRIHLVNRTLASAEAIAAHFGANVVASDMAALPRLLPQASLLVNTTSLGMQGKPALDLDIAPLRPGAVVYDIVYVPLVTALLRDAGQRGHRTVDGLGMLLHQAAPGFARWFGATPSVTPALRALLEADIQQAEARSSAPGPRQRQRI